jgi:molecular chaperone GrpE
MTAEQGWPGTPQGSPGTPGRKAEDVPVDGKTQSSPDPDRNLTPSGAGEDPATPVQGQAGQAPQGAADQVDQDLDALVDDVKRERDEYLELAQRTKADFENYRRRMAAEVQAASTRGKIELAAQLIGVIDNLERALAAAGMEPGAEEAPAEPLAEGFFLTYRELCAALGRAGVESFDPAGERFDPTRHEALQKMPVEGSEPGTVVETMQKGYLLGEQLIRPARVVVSE